MRRRGAGGATLVGVVVTAVLAGLSARAAAYPQFQFTMETSRCNACHYAPAGGGLVNGYGREEAADLISRGGDGRFLYGAWVPPRWLSLGADARFAALHNDTHAEAGTPELLFIPMQADLYGNARKDAWTLSVTLGLRGSARLADPAPTSFVVSRSHWLMWQPRQVGPYARIGRFFAPFGLRLAEHNTFVRRFLGTNTLEETYNLSGGWITDRGELHATAFVQDPLLEIGHQGAKGGVLFGEWRIADRASVGAQGRVAIGDTLRRTMGGAIAKLYVPAAHLLFMGEADLVHQTIDSVANAAQNQLAAYLGVTWFPARGFMLGANWERWQEDLDLSTVARDAVDVQLHWFPRAHWELLLYGRQLLIDGGDGGRSATLGMLQLHYWL